MSPATYRFTWADGRSVQGRVHGSGGMLGGGSEANARAHLRVLQAFAQDTASYVRAYQPKPGWIRVFPEYGASGNGPHVDIDVRGATVEIVQ